MSATLKKLLMLSLVLVLSFALVAFVGCKELPQEEIDEIIAGALAADYDTVSFDMNMPMTIETKGGSAPGKVLAEMNATGATDVVNRAMQMTMGVEITIPDTVSQDLSGEVYVVDGWIYSGVEVPDLDSEYWTKMPLDEEIWQQQDKVDQYVALLVTAVEVDYKGTETVNGVECYVFEIEPDLAKLTDLMLEETSDLGIMDFSGVSLTDYYKELSVKEWVAKDGYRLQRTEIKLVSEISLDESGMPGVDFDKMTIDVSMTIDFYDYNQPVSIELPPEALEAEEMPQMTAPFPD